MNTKGQKRLVRRLMAAKSICYSEALQELRGLDNVAWGPYVEKCEKQGALLRDVAPQDRS